MSVATEAIEILQGALTLADFLEKDEREQILKRIAQLQRRDSDNRIFIAFVGEKKAGKSSLLKMITGVPLPTAVRECTAAVCLIQLGLDWHHMTTLKDGQKTDFETLDNSKEQRILRLARRKDKLAAETSLKAIQKAEIELSIATEEFELAESIKNSALTLFRQKEQAHHLAIETLPSLWSFIQKFAWLIPAIRRRVEELHQKDIEKQEAQEDLNKAVKELEKKDTFKKEKEQQIPLRWLEAKEAAALSKDDVDKAKQGLRYIALQNKKKFDDELLNLIDVENAAAERVDILTPHVDIPVNMVLMDTPGFNTELPEHRRRAWAAIEEMADVCILVSDIRQPMPETALKMLRRIAPFCPYMHLALSKSDLALEEASILQEEPEQEVFEAKQVARDRIRPYWDGDMNIWVVAADGDNQQSSKKLFTEFWDSIPKHAHQIKTKKLGAHAINEFVELLDVHLVLIQEELKEFDALSRNPSALIGWEEKEELLKSQVDTLREQLNKDIIIHLDTLEASWLEQIQSCNTKSDVKLKLSQIQLEMETEAKKAAEIAEKGLLVGIQHYSKIIRGVKEETPLPKLLSPQPVAIEQESAKTLWALTAGGTAGIATGWALSNSLLVPILIFAGAGGISTLLLAPLAESKSKAIESVKKGIVQAKKMFSQKMDDISSQIQFEIKRQVEEDILLEREVQRSNTRQAFMRQLQKLQNLQQNLEKSKISFLLSS